MFVENCPLCGRPLGTVNIDRHHLVPKSFKGTEQFPIHKICHRKIHSVLTEKERARIQKEIQGLEAKLRWPHIDDGVKDVYLARIEAQRARLVE